MSQTSRMYKFQDKLTKSLRTKRPLHPERLIKDWQISVGDKVEVVVGVDQGKQGVVKDIIQKRNLIVVEGVRAFTRSVGPTPGYKDGKTGGVVTEERSLRYEEVLLVDPQLNKPTHVFFAPRYNPATGKEERMRFSHLSGAPIPLPPKKPHKLKDQAEGERDTPESLVSQVTYQPDAFVHPFPTALVNEMYRMSRKGGESKAL